MSPQERDRAISHLEQSKDAILNATRELTEQQWRYKSSPEKWSIAECVEHLAIVEERLLIRIRKNATGPADPEAVLAGTAGKEETILRVVPLRRGKTEAPEPVRPLNRFGSIPDLVAYFTKTRDHTIAYLRTTNHPLRSRTFPHFVFGPLDGYQWCIFVAAHTERHLHQLHAVQAAPNFPR